MIISQIRIQGPSSCATNDNQVSFLAAFAVVYGLHDLRSGGKTTLFMATAYNAFQVSLQISTKVNIFSETGLGLFPRLGHILLHQGTNQIHHDVLSHARVMGVLWMISSPGRHLALSPVSLTAATSSIWKSSPCLLFPPSHIPMMWVALIRSSHHEHLPTDQPSQCCDVLHRGAHHLPLCCCRPGSCLWNSIHQGGEDSGGLKSSPILDIFSGWPTVGDCDGVGQRKAACCSSIFSNGDRFKNVRCSFKIRRFNWKRRHWKPEDSGLRSRKWPVPKKLWIVYILPPCAECKQMNLTLFEFTEVVESLYSES